MEIGGEEVTGDAGEEGEEGLDGVAAAAVDGVDGAVEMAGELVESGEDGVGEVVEAIGREALAGGVGVEVAGCGAGATGPEFGVAAGAAVGVAAHGPVAATGDLASGFVRVSGHGCGLLSRPIIVQMFYKVKA